MNFYRHHISDFDGQRRISRMPMVYVLMTSKFEYIKVGKTNSPKQRFINIQSGCPFELALWMSIRTPLAHEVEKAIHRKLEHCRIRGEWFTPSSHDLDDLSDFFRLTNANVKEIASALL
ncbi:GIY-YIG nuclease family protein [Pseudomonas aeruginosa]|nr:GIY-YIG nuclease family protein [Pseudomonas aeruginosa]